MYMVLGIRRRIFTVVRSIGDFHQIMWYVFYNRSSQNREQKRRLCIEPIFFNEDGTIQEAKMTSQGAGRSFGIGEKIEAYRACELSGSVYISPLENGAECLTGIKDGDEAIYRYVEWEKPVNDIFVDATGSGEMKIYLDVDKEVSGCVVIYDGKIKASTFYGVSGKHEIKLQFSMINDIKVHTLLFK